MADGTPDARAVIRLLGLRPHPAEGGYFAETYRADETVPAAALPGRYDGARAFGTAIYYLLTADSVSAITLIISIGYISVKHWTHKYTHKCDLAWPAVEAWPT